jgi:hypothetical protein
MAELSAAETTSHACCAPEQRAACCEPSEKGDCCARESSTCGCSAGQTSDDVDVREQVRERYAAAARDFEQALGDAGTTDIEICETHRVHEHAAAAIIRARKPARSSGYPTPVGPRAPSDS